jgi:hypothetical protein
LLLLEVALVVVASVLAAAVRVAIALLLEHQEVVHLLSLL